MPRPSVNQWAMALARETAKRSTCLRRSVGCVLLDTHHRVVATGYNGVSMGAPHCNEELVLSYKTILPYVCPNAKTPAGTPNGCQAIHAEQNALLQCKDIWGLKACYTTASPCMTCVKLLLNTSTHVIMFDEAYPHPEAKVLWEKAGRVWTQV